MARTPPAHPFRDGPSLKPHLGGTYADTQRWPSQAHCDDPPEVSAVVLGLRVYQGHRNIIGLGAGPWAVGVLSDSLEPSLGVESLRYAMLYLLPAVMFWAACHFYLAASSLRDDLAKAPN